MTTGPAHLVQRDADGNQELEFFNAAWRLRVEVGRSLNPYELLHLGSGRAIADENYCYELTVAGTRGSGYNGGPLACRGVRALDWRVERDGDDATLVVLGQLEFGPGGPTNVRLEHRFTLLSSGGLVERLSLLHHRGRDRLELSELRFGFRKTLFDRTCFAWRPGADTGQLVPVPLRRYAGQGTDHRLAGYTAADLHPEEWTKRRGLPGRSAEAWLWCDGDGGFLVAKYNQEHIEFSVADGDYVVPRGKAGTHPDLQLEQLHSDRNLCLRFGGAGVSRGCPEHAGVLAPGERVDFGPSVVEVFDGGWQAGYACYKKLLKGKGHSAPARYQPQVHWNELYRLGWRCGSNAPLQELPELWEEARRAQAAGAQVYYFDPGWDLFEGSSVWDEERLGPVEGFMARLKREYNLGLALHVMIHTKSLDEDARIYRRRRDGTIDPWVDRTPYAGGYVCPASPVWQQQKIARLRALASAGVSFFMFDFLSYERGGLQSGDHERDELESCWSAEHGHSVPLTREEHAEGVMTVVRAIKSEFPDLTIEAHDRIAGEFLPLYYQHGAKDAHDELWGFEYMWDPYTDLLSGKALSLYEYNLAYDIPLYLHINNAHDSPTMLAFWWYASCCRHLGIGGLGPQDEQWPRLVEAMRTYRRLQPWFGNGRFVGLDVLTHLHVLDQSGTAVLTAYNLGATRAARSVAIELGRVGIPAGNARASTVPEGLTSAKHDAGCLILELDLAPLSPAVIEIGDCDAVRN
jgi:hypothetical protein